MSSDWVGSLSSRSELQWNGIHPIKLQERKQHTEPNWFRTGEKRGKSREISLAGIFSKQHTKRHGALANVFTNFPSICCRICLYNVFRFDRVQFNHLLAARRNWPKPRQHFFVFWSVVRIFYGKPNMTKVVWVLNHLSSFSNLCMRLGNHYTRIRNHNSRMKRHYTRMRNHHSRM